MRAPARPSLSLRTGQVGLRAMAAGRPDVAPAARRAARAAAHARGLVPRARRRGVTRRRGRGRSLTKRRLPLQPHGPRRADALRAAARDCAYSTLTVFVADGFEAPEWVTRTRILYLPLVDGAFHFSE